jgi:hypothetical protein
VVLYGTTAATDALAGKRNESASVAKSAMPTKRAAVLRDEPIRLPTISPFSLFAPIGDFYQRNNTIYTFRLHNFMIYMIKIKIV